MALDNAARVKRTVVRGMIRFPAWNLTGKGNKMTFNLICSSNDIIFSPFKESFFPFKENIGKK
jgi:hypothetical protein